MNLASRTFKSEQENGPYHKQDQAQQTIQYPTGEEAGNAKEVYEPEIP